MQQLISNNSFIDRGALSEMDSVLNITEIAVFPYQ